MTEIKQEISAEVNKIYKSHFKYVIDKFLCKMNGMSCLEIDIPGLATWWVYQACYHAVIKVNKPTSSYLEVHPNHRKVNSSSKHTKLVFRIDSALSSTSKQRHIKLEVGTSVDICHWADEFLYNGSAERVKEDFLNQIYLKSYMEGHALILKGLVTVKEMDWHEAKLSTQSRAGRHEKLVKDIQSLASSGTLSDFTFIVKGRELEVHKAILAGE